MAFVKIMVHAVWGTKNRYHYLTDEIRHLVIDHILQNSRLKGIHIDRINGYTDHLHCRFGLNANATIAQTIQLLKGESAHWINKQKLTPSKFAWADEYFAVSVSESMLDRVRLYIESQEEHHQKKTFQQEYNTFVRKYNFQVQG